MPDVLAAAYDVLLLDLDGVVYIGGSPIPGAPEALQQASAGGAHLAYVTNNASRTPAAVAAMLTGMGVTSAAMLTGRGAPPAAADVVTSAQAAARLLADKLPPKAKVLVIGALALRLAVRDRGLTPVSNAAEDPQAVVQGYSPGVDYGSLAEGGLAVRAGALFVGTNADSTIPNARGTAPGNGSLLTVIEHATGVKPQIAGSPDPPLPREPPTGPAAKRPLVIGARLDTDIEAAYNADADSLLVLTGVDTPASAVLAPPHRRPTYIAETLDALLPPYPPVNRTDEGATCVGWTATAPTSDNGSLPLTGAGEAIDGLRARAAAAWAVHDHQGSLNAKQVADPLDHLSAHGLKSR